MNKKKIIIFSVVVSIVVILIVLGIIIANGYRANSIQATYNGNTAAGVKLDNNNNDIVVTARLQNGNIRLLAIGEWNISSPQILKPDSQSSVLITYKGLSTKLQVQCTDSSIVSISASYSGPTSAGTVIGKNTKDFLVTASLKDGSTKVLTDNWIVSNAPVTLTADKNSELKIVYFDPITNNEHTSSVFVKCSTKTIKSLSAKYIGNALEYEILDPNNPSIIVTATYNNGDVETIKDWTVSMPAVLEASNLSTISIFYGGSTCKLSVQCSTIDPKIYKQNCKKVSYTELMSESRKYENTLVRISGKIINVSNYDIVDGYTYKIRVGKNQYVLVQYSGDNADDLLENYQVNCFGEYLGLESSSSHETPFVIAKFVDKAY